LGRVGEFSCPAQAGKRGSGAFAFFDFLGALGNHLFTRSGAIKRLSIKQLNLYCRISKSSQSVERQVRELTEVAVRNNWKIVETYIDLGISGAKNRDGRSDLDRRMKDRVKKKFDVVMVSSIDRLGRSLQQLI
jgi:hypothetical protein